MLLYAAMLVCALVLGHAALRYDLYDREPWFMVVLAVVLGAAAMWAAGQIQILFLIDLRAVEAHAILAPAATAAVSEEIAKAAVVLTVALASRRFFNDPLDGLVYGALAGLGAAMLESSHALRSVAPGGGFPGQEPVRLAGHLVMGGIGGFGFGMARMRMPGWPPALLACLGFAIALHFAWDVLAFQPVVHGAAALWRQAAAVALMLTGMVVFRALAARGGAWSREVFLPDAARSAAAGPRLSTSGSAAGRPPASSRVDEPRR